MPQLSEKKYSLSQCELCKSTHFLRLFLLNKSFVTQFNACSFVFLNPQPIDNELLKIYDEHYFLTEKQEKCSDTLKLSTAKLYLDTIKQYCAHNKKGSLIEIGCGKGDFLAQAETEGWCVTGIDLSFDACEAAKKRLKNGTIKCGDLHQFESTLGEFDVCVLSDVIEHVRSPIFFLKQIHNLLKPNGVLFIATPSTDSKSARYMGKHWMEFKSEHLTYFNVETIQTALFQTGFRHIEVKKGYKILNFDYVRAHFERYPTRFYTALLKFLSYFLPKKIKSRPCKVVASGLISLSQKTPNKSTYVLSIIIPVFNEFKTFPRVMENLLSKKISGIEFEIIIIESNSTDGTRDLALHYQNNSRIKLILENKPSGKGHAVRLGLAAATGDFILIQDADLEYDINDYDKLLEPLLLGKTAFVLGSRHSQKNRFKMRQFLEKPIQSLFLNLGHWVFTIIINVLYLQWLHDPFTMYKVFRRDCLHGLTFICDRFEFDGELLIKLIQKGYRPIEIPISYHSRSFQEGKKIRLFLDSFLLLKTVFRLRFFKARNKE